MFARFRTVAFCGLAAALLAPLPAAAQGGEEPLPRFEDALCPGVVGLQRADAELMVGRIRENAEMLGLHMAENGDCKANLIVTFVPDGQAYMAQLHDEDIYLFAGMRSDERDRLLTDTGPARALLYLEARTRDGQPVALRNNLAIRPETSMWMAHSKIYTATRNDIVMALVVFDKSKLDGVNIGQLADYATFRALSHWLPDPEAMGKASILTLFEDGAAQPDRLTEFDRAFLTQLYSGPPNLPGPAKLVELARATGVETVE